MKNNFQRSSGFLVIFAVFIFFSLYSYAHAELTQSSNDTPEKREFFDNCYKTKTAPLQADLNAKKINIYQFDERRSDAYNACADEARKIDVPAQPKNEEPAGPRNYVFVQDATLDELRGSRCLPPFRTDHIEILKHPPSTPADKAFGILESDGSFTYLPDSIEYEAHDGQKVIVPEAHTIAEQQGWDVRVHVASTALIDLSFDSVFFIPCSNEQTDAQRVILEEGYLSFLYKEFAGQIHHEILTKEAIAGDKGTQFVVWRHNEKTTYYVTEGSVDVTPTNTALAPFVVSAGEKASVTAETVTSPAPFDMGEVPQIGGESAAVETATSTSPSASGSGMPLSAIAILVILGIGIAYYAYRKLSIKQV